MSTDQKLEQLKWSELKGRAVIDIAKAKKVGTVEDLVLDPQTYKIVAFKFSPGLFNTNQIVPIHAIKGVGADALTFQLDEGSVILPEEQPFINFPTLSQLINNGVVTEGGKYIGSINNVRLSLQPLEITGYEINEGGFFSKKHSFEITSQVHYGEKLVIIPDYLLDAFTPSL